MPYSKSKLVASWAVEPVPDGPDGDSTVDSIVSIHHFGDVQTTCLVLSGGDIVLVREKDPSSGSGPQVHVPGAIDGGVTAASWSPDGELLVLTTRETELVLFLGRGGVFGDDRNGDGGPFTEVAMTADDLRLSRHVSVGWGKKETQFTGRGKKANVLRDPTIPEKVDSGSLSTADDGSVVTISWRGDGAYVAINSVVEVEAEQQQEQKLKGKRRVVRVYGRDGVLDSVSEPVDGLEAALSWRPAGNLIAGIQRKPGSDGENESVDVVFFERNGLRHGQFAVRVPPRLPSGDPAPGRVDSPVRLEWNCDSTVLAVILGESRVQLWTMGNYHWYLKQEVMLDSVPSSGSLFCWHPEDGSRLAASCSADSGQLLLAEYAFVTARGSVRPPNDYGAVAVIDGQTLKVTPFGKANIPPPMAMFELEAKTSIIDAAFDPDHSSLAVLHHGGLDLYAWQAMGSRAGTLALSKSLALDGDMTLPRGGRLLQVSFLARDELAVLVAGGDESLIHVRVDAGAGSIRRGREQLQPASPTILHNFVGPGGAYGLYGQDRVGCLYDVGSPELAPSDLRFPFQLPWCEIVAVDDKLIAFGLSRNGHLYANTRQLVRNCTSFLVTPAHLIFTTSNHLIKFVHLTDVESKSSSGLATWRRGQLTNRVKASRYQRMTRR